MKIISWNVNGIRACLKKGLLDFIKSSDADILCFQETKANQEQVELELDGFNQFWNSAEKKGYSGTLILSKINPSNFYLGMDIQKHDNEGRLITLDYPDFFLVNVYTPNAQRGLTRLDYRTKEWDVDFLNYLKKIEKIKPVIFCGDLNVAHTEIDLANPKSNKRNAGFTDEERFGFDRFLEEGFVDTFREFEKEPGNYTWWSYMFEARKKNIGWRIDYFCVSQILRDKLKSAFILPEILGSDHCPIGIKLKI
ncbi:MAG: exodeoxyribonuclease III [Dehalococcoidia bacterium]|jgi:exodeoxyribonuclease-3|nr:exodeoxyribonuclease III [Dehalococcoidia bacterium]HJN58971.1 exodeoxyribonuclease III [Dehalococcoidia bacterium]